MLARVAVLALAALAIAPSTLADNHNLRHKRDRRHRHAEVAERNADNIVQERSGNATHSHAKRFTGRGTFYYTGLGACGQYSQDSDYMVALNSDQYGSGYPGPQCFKTITISSNGVTIGGVTILDECPTCPYGALDLSPSLFNQFHSSNGGTLELTWWFEDGSSSGQATTSSADPTTTSTWVAPTTTSTWVEPSTTSTYVYTPPTTTSTWVEPSTTSTSTTPSSTWTSTTTSASSSAVASSSSSLSSVSSVSATLSASSNATLTNPYANVSAKPSSSGTVSSSGSTTLADEDGNLVAINGLVANYGQLIVTGASGSGSK